MWRAGELGGGIGTGESMKGDGREGLCHSPPLERSQISSSVWKALLRRFELDFGGRGP